MAAACPSYVWYASYGSNMLEARFLCYLKGGRVDGMIRDMPGARDPSPPTASANKVVPYRMFFGRSSPTWSSGGVCFVDTRQEQELTTQLRLWRITLQQFNDVFAQENGQNPVDAVEFVSESHLDEFRKAAPEQVHHDFLDSWYGGMLYLGEMTHAESQSESEAIVSFSLPSRDLQSFRDGTETPNPPSKPYADVIQGGLMESAGMSADVALRYLDERINAPLRTDLPS